MLAYGINTFIYAMGAIIIYHASNLIIGIFIGTTLISQCAIATAGVLLLSQLLQAFTAAIKPAVSNLDARNDAAAVKEIAFLTPERLAAGLTGFIAGCGDDLRLEICCCP